MISLQQLNTLSKKEAYQQLEQCCVASKWIHQMVESRPFGSLEDMVTKAADIWYNQCGINDYKEAFTGHPKIGNVDSLKAKFAHTLEWAGKEQSEVAHANQKTIEALAKANDTYENKFGYIFIVSASGKSAENMLNIINIRLNHHVDDEIYVAMNEQHKITVIRLAKLVEGVADLTILRSQITTHVLDTSTGLPARNMEVVFNYNHKGDWKPLGVGTTNQDGRITDVLPPGRFTTGIFKLVFHTSSYYDSQSIRCFYPKIPVQFEVTDNNHYHVPLLINPYGYSTYRGS